MDDEFSLVRLLERAQAEAAAAALEASGGRPESPKGSCLKRIEALQSTLAEAAALEARRRSTDRDASNDPAATSAGPEGVASDSSGGWEVRARELEEELQLTKALLLLKNVEVDVALRPAPHSCGGAAEEKGASSARKRVRLAGNPRLLRELMQVRERVKLLQDCCLSMRADMTALHRLIPAAMAEAMKTASGRLRRETRSRKRLEKRLQQIALVFT
jgi:hypothetical protein